MNSANNPQPPYPPTPPRPGKTHRVRNTVLGVAIAVVVLIIIAAVTSKPKPSRAAASQLSASVPATSATSRLTNGQQGFVTALLAAQHSAGWQNKSSHSALAQDGQRICDALAAGQQVHVSATGLGIAGGKIKHLAEKNICPKYLPVPAQVLMTFSGSGIRNSAPFQVGSQVTVKYDFNCSSIGGRGNFIADLQYGNQSSLNSDDQQIANSLGATGAQTTTVYPQDPGKPYYLAVNSECSWHVKVTGSH